MVTHRIISGLQLTRGAKARVIYWVDPPDLIGVFDWILKVRRNLTNAWGNQPKMKLHDVRGHSGIDPVDQIGFEIEATETIDDLSNLFPAFLQYQVPEVGVFALNVRHIIVADPGESFGLAGWWHAFGDVGDGTVTGAVTETLSDVAETVGGVAGDVGGAAVGGIRDELSGGTKLALLTMMVAVSGIVVFRVLGEA